MSDNNTPISNTLDSKGERRFVTVLFCDLLSVTSLSHQVDPEVLQQILNHFHRYCGIAINRYGGNISQLMGDGVLAYFGFPFTYEDNAHRALRAGLDIINGLADLNSQIKIYTTKPIQVRMGVDTGLVVTSEKERIFTGQAPGVIGKAPNIAAKLQEMALPNSILISSHTQRLVQGMFIVNNLGAQMIKGISESITVFQVLEESDAHSRFEAAVSFGLTPFVGRKFEMSQARRHWQAVCEAGARLIMLQGEPGIGKSRLIKNLQEDIAGIPHLTFICFCSPYYQNSALFPILSTLRHFLQLDENIDDEQKIARIRVLLQELKLTVDDYLPLWAGLFSIPLIDIVQLDDSVNEQKRKFEFSIIRWLELSALKQPMLLIIEDLHWADPSTLDLIAKIIEQGLIKNILMILSYRPEFIANWQNLEAYNLNLERLNETNTRDMISYVSNQFNFSEKILSQLLMHSGGNPLFIEESTKMSMLQSEHSSAIIPDTLQGLLLARLDRLGDNKTTAQICAVLGKSFEYDILVAVSDRDSDKLRDDIDQLLKAKILVKLHQSIENSYEFKHALIQQACYQSLLHQRRQEYHLIIAKVLIADCKNRLPEIIAFHCNCAKLFEQASEYWTRAGNDAIKNSAEIEACRYFRKAIAVLDELPENHERDCMELENLVLLGATLTTSKGYGATGIRETYQRAKILCERTNNYQQLYSVISGLWQNCISKSQLNQCAVYSDELLGLAEMFNDPTSRLVANGAVGIADFILGEYQSSITHFDKALTDYDIEKTRLVVRTIGQDPGLACMAWQMLAFEMSGNSQTATELQYYSIAIARDLEHAFTLSCTLAMSCFLFAVQKKYLELVRCGNELLPLARKHGFKLILCEARILHAFGQGMLGNDQNAWNELHAGIIEHATCNALLNHPFFYGLLATLHLKQRQHRDAIVAINNAFDLISLRSEKRFWYKEKLIALKAQIHNDDKITTI